MKHKMINYYIPRIKFDFAEIRSSMNYYYAYTWRARGMPSPIFIQDVMTWNIIVFFLYYDFLLCAAAWIKWCGKSDLVQKRRFSALLVSLVYPFFFVCLFFSWGNHNVFLSISIWNGSTVWPWKCRCVEFLPHRDRIHVLWAPQHEQKCGTAERREKKKCTQIKRVVWTWTLDIWIDV